MTPRGPASRAGRRPIVTGVPATRVDPVGDVPINAGNRFAHVDAMRAFAVVLVVLQHTGLTFVPGDSGVVVFFAISGFIITSVLLREHETTATFDIRRFYVRRLLKLGPPFVVAVLIPSLAYAMFADVDWVALLSQVLFTYNWVQIFDPAASFDVLPGSNVLWSLAVEEQFYIVFALLWLGLIRARWWRGALVALSVVVIVYATTARVVLSAEGDEASRILRGTDVRMDAIAWGVLAALAYASWRNGGSRWVGAFRSDWAPIAAAVVFVLVSAVRSDQYEQIWRGAVLPICSVAVILFGLFPTESRTHRMLYRVAAWRGVSLVGLASYSIYISHYVILEPLVEVWGDADVLLRTVALTALGLLAGVVLYHLVERPVLAWRQRAGL